MSVDQGSNSCNGSESRRIVHVVRIRSVRITELSVVLVVGLREVSEWIVVVNVDDTLENLEPKRRNGQDEVKGELELRTEDSKKSHHGVRAESSYEGRR